MKIRKSVYALIPFLGIVLSGCGLLYTNVHVPRSYRSATPGDVKIKDSDKTVSAEACNYSVLFMVSWGNGGYAGATQKALEGIPNGILYDVKSDTRVKSFLFGLYSTYCTVITGKVTQP